MMMFDELLDDIDRLDGCPQTKRRLVDLLTTRYAGQTITVSSFAERRRKARQLIDQLQRANYPLRDQVRVLMLRAGVSRRTAYRWVHHALS